MRPKKQFFGSQRKNKHLPTQLTRIQGAHYASEIRGFAANSGGSLPNVPGVLVRTVTNLGHLDFTLEATTHARVDTTGLPPGFWHTHVPVRLVALELGHTLLNNVLLD